MKKAKEIRNGNVLKMDGNILLVQKAEHFKPSEKKCVMKLKLKNMLTGQNVNKDIYASDVVDDLRLEEKEMQYLYSSGTTYTFMDTENYEQLEIEADFIGEQIIFLQEEMMVYVKFYEGKPLTIELPHVVIAEIEYTENVEKGNTANQVIKDATLANGHVIKVPDFINIGDKIKIDTRTGEYMSRA